MFFYQQIGDTEKAMIWSYLFISLALVKGTGRPVLFSVACVKISKFFFKMKLKSTKCTVEFGIWLKIEKVM